jgi:hypothetical protein
VCAWLAGELKAEPKTQATIAHEPRIAGGRAQKLRARSLEAGRAQEWLELAALAFPADILPHEVRELAQLLTQPGNDVVRSDDSDESTACIHDRHSPNAVRAHRPKHGTHILELARDHKFSRHHVSDLRPQSCFGSGRERADDQVAIAQHRDRPVFTADAIDDDESADVMLDHAPGRFHQRLIGASSDDPASAETSGVHARV